MFLDHSRYNQNCLPTHIFLPFIMKPSAFSISERTHRYNHETHYFVPNWELSHIWKRQSVYNKWVYPISLFNTAIIVMIWVADIFGSPFDIIRAVFRSNLCTQVNSILSTLQLAVGVLNTFKKTKNKIYTCMSPGKNLPFYYTTEQLLNSSDMSRNIAELNLINI